jgi:hypothetical protein
MKDGFIGPTFITEATETSNAALDILDEFVDPK